MSTPRLQLHMMYCVVSSVLFLQRNRENGFIHMETCPGYLKWSCNKAVEIQHVLGDKGDLLFCLGHAGNPARVTFTQVGGCWILLQISRVPAEILHSFSVRFI